MVQDDKPVGLDGVQVKFDDERVVCDAGSLWSRRSRCGSGSRRWPVIWCGCGATGRGRRTRGARVMALVYAMVLGADSIDDCGVLRAGRTGRLLGGWMPAPSTLGTFLRAFTFGHVRQLDALLGRSIERACKAGAGPGDQRLVIDVDSFVGEVCGRLKQGAAYGYTRLLGYHPILATRGHARDAAHPPAEGLGEHAEGDQAVHRRADRPRRPGRRDRDQAAARRLGVFEHEGVRAPRTGGLAVLDRGADDQDRPRRRRSDRQGPPGSASSIPTTVKRRSPRPSTATAG